MDATELSASMLRRVPPVASLGVWSYGGATPTISVVGDLTGCRTGRRVAAELSRSWCGIFCVVVGVEFGLASGELAAFGVGGGQGDGLVDREQRFSCETGAGQ